MVTPTPIHTIDMTFAQRLTTLRHQHGLTQQVLAERSGLHISNIRRYEAGTNQPTLEALRQLTLALNTTADTLLFDPDERDPHTDDLRLAFEAATRLDPEHQATLKATLEGLLLRNETRRWQTPTAS
jgi:transcriptional regulator with XRE-family HTH domain